MKKVVINYKDLTKKEKVFYWIRKIATGILYVAILVSLTIASIYSLMHNSSDSESSVISASADTYSESLVFSIADSHRSIDTSALYYRNLYTTSMFRLLENDSDDTYYFSNVNSTFASGYDYFIDYGIDFYICDADGEFVFYAVHIINVDFTYMTVTFDSDVYNSSGSPYLYAYITFADYYYFHYVSEYSFAYLDISSGFDSSPAVYGNPYFSYITLNLYLNGSGYPLTMYIPYYVLGYNYDNNTFFFVYDGSSEQYLGGIEDPDVLFPFNTFGSFYDYDYFVYDSSHYGYEFWSGYDAISKWFTYAGYDLESYYLSFLGNIDGDSSKVVYLNLSYLGNEEFYIYLTLDYGVTNQKSTDLSQYYCSGDLSLSSFSFVSSLYSSGYSSGYSEGYTDGYNTGFTDGMEDGLSVLDSAYDSGYSAGYTDGVASCDSDYSNGYVSGYYNGYNDGSADGYSLGKTNGYSLGVDDGYSWGYEEGFSDAGLEAWSAPGVTLLYGVAEIFEVKIFGYFSLGTFVQIFIYIFVVLMFIRMFSG